MTAPFNLLRKRHENTCILC